jgi:hypothetical protein
VDKIARGRGLGRRRRLDGTELVPAVRLPGLHGTDGPDILLLAGCGLLQPAAGLLRRVRLVLPGRRLLPGRPVLCQIRLVLPGRRLLPRRRLLRRKVSVM